MSNESSKDWRTKQHKQLKVAVVHYWLVNWRGGEQVLQSILQLFPQADVFTLFADPRLVRQHLTGHKIQASSWNKPLLRRHYQKLFPVYPEIVASLKLPDKYDLVISSESGPAKGVQVGQAKHLCYVHSPMRYCYDFRQVYLDAVPIGLKTIANLFFERLKRWDLKTATNVDQFLTNSKNVQRRVFKAYQRESEVVYPAINEQWFQPLGSPTPKSYFLGYGAMTPYKGFGLLVEAFNQNGLPLILVGNGSEKARLKAQAASNIRFVEAVDHPALLGVLKEARALIFPVEEDFGLIPLEAMSRGVPVIAYAKGGALETLHQDLNAPAQSSAIFFEQLTADSLNQAVQTFMNLENEFDPGYLQQQSKKFSQQSFRQNFAKHAQQLIDS